ncbi:MAG TPA: hypothetical protein EYO33_29915 [Phycisphaerales bacterium]|nr:hypothetical protein [Phycisphaerales bacterium]
MRKSLGESGPKLYSPPGAGRGARADKVELQQPGRSLDSDSHQDADVARTLLQRLRRGGTRLNDSDQKRLKELQVFGQ